MAEVSKTGYATSYVNHNKELIIVLIFTQIIVMNNMLNTIQRLTIRISRNSLSFSAVQVTPEGTKVIFEPYVIKSGISMAANLREAFKTAELPMRGYKRAMVMIDEQVLMVPLDLFDSQKMEDIYYHSFPRTEEQRVVMANPLTDLNAVAVFSVNRDLRLVLTDHFADVRFATVSTPVWRHLYQRNFTGARAKLYVHFHDKRMEVFAFNQNRFRYCNSFPAQHTNDILYDLLGIWNILSMDVDTDELYVTGENSEKEQLLNELKKYLQRVYFINPAGDFNRAPVTQIEGMPYDLMTYYVRGKH